VTVARDARDTGVEAGEALVAEGIVVLELGRGRRAGPLIVCGRRGRGLGTGERGVGEGVGGGRGEVVGVETDLGVGFEARSPVGGGRGIWLGEGVVGERRRGVGGAEEGGLGQTEVVSVVGGGGVGVERAGERGATTRVEEGRGDGGELDAWAVDV
jgi:hypothetical protein